MAYPKKMQMITAMTEARALSKRLTELASGVKALRNTMIGLNGKYEGYHPLYRIAGISGHLLYTTRGLEDTFRVGAVRANEIASEIENKVQEMGGRL